MAAITEQRIEWIQTVTTTMLLLDEEVVGRVTKSGKTWSVRVPALNYAASLKSRILAEEDLGKVMGIPFTGIQITREAQREMDTPDIDPNLAESVRKIAH